MKFPLSQNNIFWFVLACIFVLETISLLAYHNITINVLVFTILTISTFFISLRFPLVGLGILAAEIVIGSFGYLFYIQPGDFKISIRLAIFIALFIAWLIRRIRYRETYFFKSSFVRPITLFALTIGFGIIHGLISGNGLTSVFLDANGYFFFALILIISDTVFTKNDIKKIGVIILAATSWVILKTFVVLTFFSHVTDESLIRYVYRWIHVTRVGEITAMVGSVSRIFFQAHLWIVFLLVVCGFLLFIFWNKNQSLTPRLALGTLFVLSMSVILISYSRSFWLGLAVGLSIVVIFLVSKRYISFRMLLSAVVVVFFTVIIGLGINAFLIFIPLPGLSGELVNTGDLLVDRVTTIDEPAANSRFALLEPLFEKIVDAPFFGHGFGTTVTYQSSDPRTSGVNNGLYTTYSFEWGYLDTITEIGILGLLMYSYLLYRIFYFGFQFIKSSPDALEQWFIIGLLSSLIVLMCIHLSTPYLNHPLGIFYILLCIQCITVLTRRDGVPSDTARLKKAV